MSEAAREPNMKRRCLVHDYKSRSIYLVTLEVAGRRPRLGRINPQGLTPRAPNRPVAEQGAFQEAGVSGAAWRNAAQEAAASGAAGQNAAQEAGVLREARRSGGERVSASNLSEAELREINAGLFEPSELGRRVAEEFMKIGEHVAGVKPIIAQAMPDHFHGVLFVTRAIDRSLGSIIAGFKGRCSQVAQGLTPRAPNRFEAGQNAFQEAAASGAAGRNGASPPLATGEPIRSAGLVRGTSAPAITRVASLWEPGYHDRILTSEGQLEKMIRYVIDNPRRAALRLRHRDLFTNVRRLAGRGRAFDAYGNGFLLQRAEIVQVQCSRRFFGFKRVEKSGQPVPADAGATEPANRQARRLPNGARAFAEAGRNWRASKIARNAAGEAIAAFETPEFAAKREALFAAAKRGAVLCSPCISDGERALAYAAVDAGCPLIVLRNEPFPSMFKPSGRFFDACAEGRLLILHPQPVPADAGATEPANRQARWLPNGARAFGNAGRNGATPLWATGAPNRRAGSVRGASAPAITRGECLALNAIAAEICGGNASEIVYHGLT